MRIDLRKLSYILFKSKQIEREGKLNTLVGAPLDTRNGPFKHIITFRHNK